MRSITMRYLKAITPSRSSLLFFCALLSLASIAVLSRYDDNNTLLSRPSSPISKIVQAAAAISSYHSPSYSRSDFRGTATITNIQLPGLISNNNSNNNPPSTFPPPSKSGTTNTSNATSNNPNAPPAPPIIHNTKSSYRFLLC